LATAFAEAGISVLTGRSVTGVRRVQRGGEVTVVLDDGCELLGDELLVAVGRTPNTADLGLETVGLQPGGYVQVDDSMHLLGGWLYACGDVTGRNLLTHMGKYLWVRRRGGSIVRTWLKAGPPAADRHRAYGPCSVWRCRRRRRHIGHRIDGAGCGQPLDDVIVELDAQGPRVQRMPEIRVERAAKQGPEADRPALVDAGDQGMVVVRPPLPGGRLRRRRGSPAG
jgi:hypothetical protein